MVSIPFTRRDAAALVFAVLAAPAAWAQAPTRFRDIRLDLAPLRATGDTVTADAFQREAPALLATAFAAHLAPGDRSAPTLVVRVDTATYGPRMDNSPFGSEATDWVAGVAIVTAGGRQVARYPFSISRKVSPDTDVTGNEGKLRIDGLAQVLAYWLPSEMGL
ncbi:MAG: hypothetical protein ACLPN5_21980 [Roseiarcus sp.]